MRLLFVCDGRSPIATNWIRYFVDNGDEVHLASTFNFTSDLDYAGTHIIPVAFSQLKGRENKGDSQGKGGSFLWRSETVNMRTAVRRILAPLTINSASKQLTRLIAEIQPNLVHAMRIPFEGILAAEAVGMSGHIPLIVSVWGNDFTLHAGATKWMGNATKQVLSRTDGLHTDCLRDQKLAIEWGYREGKPTLVVPGNGGIDTSLFYPNTEESPQEALQVINPRGIRAYIRNDTFFMAIPQIIKELPEATFICPGMAGEVEAERWIEKLDLSAAVQLLPKVSRQEMAEFFRASSVTVSPSTHDGTPNTLLEGMACGSYPVASDLDSIREWIDPGVNGSLINPGEPDQLARAVIDALNDQELRKRASGYNLALINKKAEYKVSMQKVLGFYREFIR